MALACGDNNDRLQHIQWTSWTPQGANGTGERVRNNCIPDCASGQSVTNKAEVRLSHPVQDERGSYFRSVTVGGEVISK